MTGHGIARKGGTIIVARDHNGVLLDGCNWKGRDTSALNTEARAILQGINLACRNQWKDIIIESDSEYLMQQLTGTKANQDWRVANIPENIQDNSNQLHSVRWNFLRRSANQVANWVATQ